MPDETEYRTTEPLPRDEAAAEEEHEAGSSARGGAKREWIRGAILTGMTLGAVVIANAGGPTTVTGVR